MNLIEKIIKQAKLPEFGYHQTAYENAVKILDGGFKTGAELNKGEGCGGIFFSPNQYGQPGVNYSRGEGRNVFLKVDLSSLNILNATALEPIDGKPSYQQPAYLIRRGIEELGKFPKGYDGVYWENYDGNGIYEIALTKEAANKTLIPGMFNSRGKQIE